MKKKKLYLYFSIGYLILFVIFVGDLLYSHLQNEKLEIFSMVIKLVFSTSQALLFYILYKMEVKKEVKSEVKSVNKQDLNSEELNPLPITNETTIPTKKP